MAAVVRVKRRINEEPLSAFVLNCKKRKVDDNLSLGGGGNDEQHNLIESKDEVSTVLKFAGTVETQEEPIASQITRLTKEDAKNVVQKVRNPNLTEKCRQERRQNQQENRFKVVNCSRTLDNTSDADTSEITIVDIEKQSADSTISGGSTSYTDSFAPTDSDEFVYDLYVPENDQQIHDFDYTDNSLSIRPYDIDLVFEDSYNNDAGDSDDSEDSNQENHEGNEYPDEEGEYESVDDDDIVRAVRNFNLNDDRELSSDDDVDYVYSLDAEDLESDLDVGDVYRYGKAYAKYKSKVLKGSDSDSSDNDSDKCYIE